MTQLIGGVAVASLSGQASLASESGLRVHQLRVEWWLDAPAIDTQRPRFHWTLRAAAKARGVSQSAFRLQILTDEGARSSVFDSGKVIAKSLNFQPTTALSLRPQSRYVVLLTVWDQSGAMSSPYATGFATGLFKAGDNRATWIASAPDLQPYKRAIEGRVTTVDTATPMSRFRRSFGIDGTLVAAHAVVVGLGQYQLWLNGRKLSPDGLNGHWTDYAKRVAYDAYDLTPHLRAGSNELLAALGNGFFNVESITGRYAKLNGAFGQPQLWLQLRLLYADGREAFVVTDPSWEVATAGTTLSSIYSGEDFDARLDAVPEWRPAVAVAGPAGRLEASRFTPMRAQRRLRPRRVTKLTSGGRVYDLGLNHSGRPEITLRDTTAGQVVRLIPSELLMEDGSADQQSMVGGKTRGYRGIHFQYTCKGAATETWQPQFTYTGYRYLQIEGAAKAQIAAVSSLFMYDDLREAGAFECSDKNMEAIHGLIKQALLSNLASVITDCPHREKLGWLEQIYLNADTALMNMDAVALYEKMLADMRDTQTDRGMIPSIVPEFVQFIDRNGRDTPFRDSPEWGAALIMGAWYVFRLYGDIGVLEQNYAAMQARVDYMRTRLNAEGLIDFGLGDWYDIGPNKPGYAQLTSRKMTGTATYVLELKTLGEIARRLGKAEADDYVRRAEALKLVMQQRLFDATTSRFDTGSQTAQAMAIVLGLLPKGHEQKALDVLIADIRSRNNHVTAGDIGFHYVVRALSDNGCADVLYAMLSRTDKPAYLEQVRNGATALTEAWDSWREGSQNHFMLGHAELWFWSGLGGVNVDLSSDEPLVIAPQRVEGIERTAVAYESVFGRIRSELSHRGRRITVIAEVPVGATALVRVPCTAAESLREGGRKIGAAEGVMAHLHQDKVATLRVGSGTYRFTAELS